MRSVLIGLLLGLLPCAVLSGAPLVRLPYEPAEVALTGTIRRQTFPGPPNYEAIATGDAPEAYWILTLEQPVDVIGTKGGTKGDLVNETEHAVREVQLVLGVLGKKSYRDYPDCVGVPVTVTGTLSHAMTAHHKTAVLIAVRDVKQRRP